eukprot:340968_1
MANSKRKSRHNARNIHRLHNQASYFFKRGQWRLAVDSYHELFESQSNYLLVCMNDYWIAIANCIEMLIAPHFKMTQVSGSPNLGRPNVITNDLKTKHKSEYKSIEEYYTARITFVEKMKKNNLNDYHIHSTRAIIEYLNFLISFSNNYRLIYKCIRKIQICNNGHIFRYISDLYFLIRTGNVYFAQKLIQHVKQYTFQFDVISDILLIFLKSYMYCRLHQYQKCLQLWAQVENRFDYKTIDHMLFPKDSLNKTSCSNLYPQGIRAVGIFFPNTTILDFKLECYIELQQYQNARILCDFYYNLWGTEDQTIFYDGYLDLRMGKLSYAKMKLRYIPVPVCHQQGHGWKQNQHYFAGLLYYNLKEYNHAKYHLVCAEYSEEFGFHIAEHFYWLSKTLIHCKEWKLSKRFLLKAKKLTMGIECIKSRYDSMMYLLDNKLSELQCENIKCALKETDILKLKVCKGCGKSVYCSRRCQKVDWIKHRKQCDNTWLDLCDMMNTRKYIKCPYDHI